MQSLIDRQDICDLFIRYANGLDHKRWEDLDDVFTKDASASWLEGQWLQDNRADIVAFISGVLRDLPTHHLLGNYVVKIDGDKAEASCHVRGHHQGVGDRAHLFQETLGKFGARAERRNGVWRFVYFTETMLTMNGTFEALGDLPG